MLGLLEAFAAGYLSSQYKDAVAFLVILIVLFAMPRGLFGQRSKSSGYDLRAQRRGGSRLELAPLLVVINCIRRRPT